MRSRRLCLLLGLVVLAGIGLAGCTGRMQSEPKALFTASPAEEVVPFTASFDATLSYDPDGTIASYLWNFGDGSDGSGPVVTHAFSKDGTYCVQLTVANAKGDTSSSTLTVHALNPAPTAAFSWSPMSEYRGEYVVAATEWVSFDGSASTDDGKVVAYDWSFGNGSTASGATVVHRFMSGGVRAITLTVTDDDGGTSSHTETIRVLGGGSCSGDEEDGSCQ